MRTRWKSVIFSSFLLLTGGAAGAARVPNGWVGGADLLLGVGVPLDNPVSAGESAATGPAVQGQLRVGHELGNEGRFGRLSAVLAGFATHPSGFSDWGTGTTYALAGYGGLRYETPLFKYIRCAVGGGYGGQFAA